MFQHKLLFLISFLVTLSFGYPLLNVTGFAWAENMAFDGKGNLFVSDAGVGALYRISLSTDGAVYDRYTHIGSGPFFKFFGLAMGADDNILYANARARDTQEPCIVAINTNTPEVFSTVVNLPAMGNGLAYNNRTGMIYATSGGFLLPGNGKVILVDVENNSTSIVVDGLEGADGCFIDQERQYLYISEVLRGRVIRYAINEDNSLTQLLEFFAPSMRMLDDFCLSADGSQMYGADHSAGKVVVFNSDGSSRRGVVLMEDLITPTSVRFAVGLGFNSSVVFASEGASPIGIPMHYPTNRRVLQSPYALNIST